MSLVIKNTKKWLEQQTKEQDILPAGHSGSIIGLGPFRRGIGQR